MRKLIAITAGLAGLVTASGIYLLRNTLNTQSSEISKLDIIGEGDKNSDGVNDVYFLRIIHPHDRRTACIGAVNAEDTFQLDGPDLYAKNKDLLYFKVDNRYLFQKGTRISIEERNPEDELWLTYYLGGSKETILFLPRVFSEEPPHVSSTIENITKKWAKMLRQ